MACPFLAAAASGHAKLPLSHSPHSPQQHGLIPSDSSDSLSSSSSHIDDPRLDGSGRRAGTHQAWTLTRPVLGHDPKLTRRQLRTAGRSWSHDELAAHRYADDAWIAVDGRVYDITEHLVNHPGWDSGCQVSTVLSILAHIGTDCSKEFHDIHRPYPDSWRQLAAYYIGELRAAAAGEAPAAAAPTEEAGSCPAA
jgi:cytochrome b involved in lipid metabolism